MPLKNPKAKGSRNERRSMAILEAAGYRCTKSGGSLGEFDIIGIGPAEGDVVLCQVKSNRPPSPVDRAVLKDYSVPHNVRKLCHIWYDRKHLPTVFEL